MDHGIRLNDSDAGQALLKGLTRVEGGRFQVTFGGQVCWLEAFDQPLVARHITKSHGLKAYIDFPYDYRLEVTLNPIHIDEWDRFYGLTDNNIPFVLSRTAQMEFFDLLDEFSDDTITYNGNLIPTEPWLKDAPELSQKGAAFWTQLYQLGDTKWDLHAPAPGLLEILPQLKLNKQRILVLGCGRGHDAALLAEQGHIVTGADVSPHAIQIAKSLHPPQENLTWLEMDALHPPPSSLGRFDCIVEHTLFCAINPSLRSKLVQSWRKLLAPGGHLLGVFFIFPQASKAPGEPPHPPFGASEWELRQRLQADFDFRFWRRLRNSPGNRLGRELLIYAQKRAVS